MAETRQLISVLASGLRPVRPIAPPRVRLAWWTALVLALVVPNVVSGVRRGLLERVSDGVFAAGLVLAALTAAAAAGAALRAAVPGARAHGLRLAALASVAAWGALLLVRALGEPGAGFGTVVHCAVTAVLIGCAPAVLLSVLLRRGHALAPRSAGAFALLAAMGAGALGLGMVCPDGHGLHLAVSHWLPVVALAALGAAWPALAARRR